MSSTKPVTQPSTKGLDTDLEAALNPAEVEGFYRDSRECAQLALIAGGGALLLSPPTPRPKKG
ncbi:hypothetical protein [Streptomyces sp. NPDC005805]|uniref:hypothetical protein n=1 Tax=Streptomyces sp. NPDC005805 TaxID=3157068 RepID=UPI0033EBD3C5